MPQLVSQHKHGQQVKELLFDSNLVVTYLKELAHNVPQVVSIVHKVRAEVEVGPSLRLLLDLEDLHLVQHLDIGVLSVNCLDALSQAYSQHFVLQLHAQPFVGVQVTLPHAEEELVEFGVGLVYVVLDPLEERVSNRLLLGLVHLSDSLPDHDPLKRFLRVRLDDELLMQAEVIDSL